LAASGRDRGNTSEIIASRFRRVCLELAFHRIRRAVRCTTNPAATYEHAPGISVPAVHNRNSGRDIAAITHYSTPHHADYLGVTRTTIVRNQTIPNQK
jgi:hypothetical protein